MDLLSQSYQAYKEHGSQRIKATEECSAAAEQLTDQERELIEEVYDVTLAWALRNMTHEERPVSSQQAAIYQQQNWLSILNRIQ